MADRTNIYVGIVAVFCIWAFTGCETPYSYEGFRGDQLSVSATFNPDEGFIVFVSPVAPFDPEHQTNLIENAVVEIYESGQFLRVLSPFSLNGRVLYTDLNLRPTEGIPYRLRVVVPGYISVDAVDTMPRVVPSEIIEAMPVDSQMLPNGLTRYSFSIILAIEDPTVIENYYHLFVELHGKNPGGQERFVLGNLSNAQETDLSITPYVLGQSFLIDGAKFDGEVKQISLKAQVDLETGWSLENVQTDLRSVSKPYYDFHKSVISQLNASSNPVVEPTTLYTNIREGFGFWGGFQSSRNIETF